MKRFLTFMMSSALILGLTLTGCANAPTAPPKSEDQTSQVTKPPEAEAGATRDSVIGPEKRVVMGFYTDPEGLTPGSKESMTKNIKMMDEVAFFWYSFDGNGKVVPTGKVDLKIKEEAQKNGAKAYALVHNMNLTGKVGFNDQLAHSVLSNPAKRANLVTNLVNLTTKDGWDGISLDVEKTPPGDRKQFLCLSYRAWQSVKSQR